MRFILPLVSLLAVAGSMILSRLPVTPESWFCRQGLCRLDQSESSIEADGLGSQNLQMMLTQNPGNPLLWATYGEWLNLQPNAPDATALFDHALELGPHQAAVQMRIANYDFTNGRLEHGRLMAKQILAETGAFDQILFSYLTAAKLPMSQVLDLAIPATPRPAQTWLAWLRSNGSEPDVQATWAWMLKNRIVDEKSAIAVVSTLWERKEYFAAQEAWLEWLGARAGDYLRPEHVWDSRFQNPVPGSPFEWVIDSSSSVQMKRDNGLEIRFAGTDNVAFTHLRQSVPLPPGAYRLLVEVEASGLTTDQHPLIRVSNPTLNKWIPIEDTSGRAELLLDFSISPGSELTRIQVERQPSEKFDNKIRGTVHFYLISVKPR